MRRLLIGLVLCVAMPGFALAWGETGHRTLAEIAFRNLSPPAAAAVAGLLRDGREQFVDSAIWADEFRDENAETSPWHVVEIPEWADAYDRVRDCPADQCIVEKIKEFKTILADAHASHATRALALKFLIHLVGDIHMPLHALAPLNRPGGVWVSIGDTVDSLHLWWDNGFVDALGPNEKAVADILEDLIADDSRVAWTNMAPEEWADESFAIARDFVRENNIPRAVLDRAAAPDAPMVLEPSVIEAIRPIVAERLHTGGRRLARLLNDALQ